MKDLILVLVILVPVILFAQANPKVSPSRVSSASYFDKTPPLKTFVGQPSIVDEFAEKRNEGIEKSGSYPYEGKPLPNGIDPLLQSKQGDKTITSRDLNKVFDGISDIKYVPDNNGTIGKNHYLQTVNQDYAIFDLQGNVVIPKTSLTSFFGGIFGSDEVGFGDPIVLYDDQAERWLLSEISWLNDHYKILIAISQSDDPTQEWYRWGFDVYTSIPDYPKFGISANSFLVGTNSANWGGDDIFAFDRKAMLAGNPNAKMVQFENPNRPENGFTLALPIDTDGPFATNLGAAQFIALNDDAWNGGEDQLWIYDLVVDWSNPNAATFQRTETVDVADFDSDFGELKTEAIFQPNGQGLMALSGVLMNRVTSRVYGDTESLVCLHTVDVDGSNHAGLRWYELVRANGGEWTVRQSGTYAPDDDSRWMGSIAQNANHEIAIGYSVASTTRHPSIRICGQSAEENVNASGLLDFQEISIFEGVFSQDGSVRWGDYGNIAVDPVGAKAFWYAGTYVLADEFRKGTKIAAFDFSPGQIVSNFTVSQEIACNMDTVMLSDMTTGIPSVWDWNISPSTFTFVNGTDEHSQNPRIIFNTTGNYTIQLIASNSISADAMIKTDVVKLQDIYADFSVSTSTVSAGSSVLFFEESGCDPDSWLWSFQGGEPSSFSGQHPPAITYNMPGSYDVTLAVTKNGSTQSLTQPNYVKVINCQYCLSKSLDTVGEYISRVTINDFDNQSGSTFYSDFSNLVAHAAPGDTVPILIEITYKEDLGFDEYVRVWVDWNSDCVFSKLDEQYHMGKITTTDSGGVDSILGSIIVPVQVSPGVKRIRITLTHHYSPIPCVTSGSGEVEDYSIVIEPNSPNGIKDASALNIGVIYPNPTIDNLTMEIDYPKTVEVPVTFIDMDGQIIKMQKVNFQKGSNRVHFSVARLPSGYYYVSVGDLGGFRFVKQ